MKHALMIAELVPGYGRSGQEKYNADIVDAFRNNGFAIDIIITSPRFDLIGDSYVRSEGDWNSIKLLHFFPTRFGLVPRTWSSLARRIKFMLPRRKNAKVAGGKVAPIGRWLSRRERRAVQLHIADQRPDIILTDTIFRSVAAVEENAKLAPDILILHDIFNQRCRSFENNGFSVHPKIEAHDEQQIWRRHDGLISINAIEGAFVENNVPLISHNSIYPVVNVMRSEHDSNSSPGVIFIGANTPHNHDAMSWFLTHCWKDVVKSAPNAILHIVGAVGDGFEHSDDILVHGKVDDLASIAAQCRVAINPLQMGSGLKIKMIDYFALGLPCVATDVGAEGFPDERPRPFIVTSQPEEFAAHVAHLLNDTDAAQQLSSRIDDYIGLFSKGEAGKRVAMVVEAIS